MQFKKEAEGFVRFKQDEANNSLLCAISFFHLVEVSMLQRKCLFSFSNLMESVEPKIPIWM